MKATMMIFKTEPRLVICFNGHHKKSTAELIQKVANPMLSSSFDEIPCAETVQGLTPAFEAMRMASSIKRIVIDLDLKNFLVFTSLPLLNGVWWY